MSTYYSAVQPLTGKLLTGTCFHASAQYEGREDLNHRKYYCLIISYLKKKDHIIFTILPL